MIWRHDNIENQKYYVYRLVNSDGVIVYVGRTTNLMRRFRDHDHLKDDTYKAEYIECLTMADMVWKEIYYMNLYHNSLSLNKQNLYDGITDIGLNDTWMEFTEFRNYHLINPVRESLIEAYNKYTKNPSQYKGLIHIVDHERLNKLGKERNAFSVKWYSDLLGSETIQTIRNNASNFSRNVSKKLSLKSSEELVWTVFPEFKEILKNKGYASSYESMYIEQPIEHCNKRFAIYLCNHFYPAKKENCIMSEDEYALSILLRFLFNTTVLRDSKEIWIYIPSYRMRSLLRNWNKEDELV